MKKIGFTLPELLITLTIIGVVAAMVAPNIATISPSKNKYKILKAYNTLTNINKALLEDPGIYWTPTLFCPTVKVNGECTCEGLQCTQVPIVEPYNTSDYTGTKKYMALVVAHLEGTQNGNLTNSNVKFTTADGMVWNIKSLSNAAYSVEIDLNGDEKTVIKLNVDKEGKVTGEDSLSKKYIKDKFAN